MNYLVVLFGLLVPAQLAWGAEVVDVDVAEARGCAGQGRRSGLCPYLCPIARWRGLVLGRKPLWRDRVLLGTGQVSCWGTDNQSRMGAPFIYESTEPLPFGMERFGVFKTMAVILPAAYA